MLYLPISLFIFIFLLLHNFINFPLHFFLFPPPQFYHFPSSMFLLLSPQFYYFPSPYLNSLSLRNINLSPPPPYSFFYPPPSQCLLFSLLNLDFPLPPLLDPELCKSLEWPTKSIMLLYGIFCSGQYSWSLNNSGENAAFIKTSANGLLDKADKPKAPRHNPCTCKFCETFKNPRTVRKK